MDDTEKKPYWIARAAIEKAAREKDDKALAILAKIYPEIVRDMVNFCKNHPHPESPLDTA